VAKEDFLMVRTELGRISWWWQGAWLVITRELLSVDRSVDHLRVNYYPLTMEEKGVYPS
jgi:hypothetical protein